jgi:hypothetical protein
MLPTGITDNQNNRQTMISGGDNILSVISPIFVSNYLHFSEIILHTHSAAINKKYISKTSIVYSYIIGHLCRGMSCCMYTFIIIVEFRDHFKKTGRIRKAKRVEII